MNGTYRDFRCNDYRCRCAHVIRIQHERHDEKMKLTPQDYLKIWSYQRA